MDEQITPTKRKRRTKREILNDAAKLKKSEKLHKEITKQGEISNSRKNKIPLHKMSKYITIGRIEAAIKTITESECGLLINEYFLKAFGSLDAAAIISYLLYIEHHLTKPEDKEKWFVTKYESIQKYTGCKKTKVSSVIKELKSVGIIDTKMKGVPALQHFLIDKDCLFDILVSANPPKGYHDPVNMIIREHKILNDNL